MSEQTHQAQQHVLRPRRDRSHRSLRRRTLMAAGTALAVFALGGTLAACGEDKKDSSSSDSTAPGTEEQAPQEPAAEEPAADAAPLADGETSSYEDGLEITVSGLKEYTPSEFQAGHVEGNTAYQVTIVLANTGQEDFDGTFAAATGKVGKTGAPAETILDDGIDSGLSGVVAAGQEKTVTMAFDVPPGGGSLDIEVKPDVTASEPSVWTFPVA